MYTITIRRVIIDTGTDVIIKGLLEEYYNFKDVFIGAD